MSDKISVERMLDKHELDLEHTTASFRIKVTAAIKEIVEAVVDKCAEKVKTKSIEKYDNHETYYENHIDKQSILQVKQMINYE